MKTIDRYIIIGESLIMIGAALSFLVIHVATSIPVIIGITFLVRALWLNSKIKLFD